MSTLNTSEALNYITQAPHINIQCDITNHPNTIEALYKFELKQRLLKAEQSSPGYTITLENNEQDENEILIVFEILEDNINLMLPSYLPIIALRDLAEPIIMKRAKNIKIALGNKCKYANNTEYEEQLMYALTNRIIANPNTALQILETHADKRLKQGCEKLKQLNSKSSNFEENYYYIVENMNLKETVEILKWHKIYIKETNPDERIDATALGNMLMYGKIINDNVALSLVDNYMYLYTEVKNQIDQYKTPINN